MLKAVPVSFVLDESKFVNLREELINKGLLDTSDNVSEYSFLPVVGIRVADLRYCSEQIKYLTEFSDTELNNLGLWYLQSKYSVYTLNIMLEEGSRLKRYYMTSGFIVYDKESDSYSLFESENVALLYETLQSGLIYCYSYFFVNSNKKKEMNTKKDSGYMLSYHLTSYKNSHGIPVVRFIGEYVKNSRYNGLYLNYVYGKGFYISNLDTGVIVWTGIENDTNFALYKSPTFYSVWRDVKLSQELCQGCLGISQDELVENFADIYFNFIKLGNTYILLENNNVIGDNLTIPLACECLIVASEYKLSKFKNVVLPANLKVLACRLQWGDKAKHKGCTLYVKKGSPSRLLFDYLLQDKIYNDCSRTLKINEDVYEKMKELRKKLATVDDILANIKSLPIKIKLY